MKDISQYIDHTFLNPCGESGAIAKLCREAKKYSFCSVCVNPAFVSQAKKLLKNTDVNVCTVIGFPLGQNTTAVKIAEALDAIEDGADELDFVINQRYLKFDPELCQKELDDLVYFTSSNRKIVRKLIIECCNLTKEEKIAACKMAKKAGFDFVKTSTGFGSGGATVEDVRLMRKAVGKKMGVKASGGIRTKEDALRMIEAGATRLGCSCGVQIVK
jgi:deoxyribose-phosphate aldolase